MSKRTSDAAARSGRKQEASTEALRGARDLAYAQAASSELTRDINRDVVLERVRALQPVSRVDLARASGLQPSTVSSIVEQLLSEEWIREGALVKTARGRRPTLLSLNDNLVILAADIRPRQAVVALLDLNGRFIERQLVPLSADPERGVAAVASAMRGFQQRHPDLTFEGVGLSLPGRVDPQTNKLRMAPNLPWRDYNISGRLREELKLSVELENAANACLLAELWFGRMDGVRNAVLVTISEGVGAAILAEGRLVSGAHGMAGEFGHICVDPEGPQCGCGANGCWEVFASSRAALRYYGELCPKANRLTFMELVSLAIDGDAAAASALERQAVAIGKGLHLLDAVLSPEVILLAGDVTIVAEMYRPLIERECRAGMPAGMGARLQLIGDGEVARLRGATAMVLQRHSGYYRAAHTRKNLRWPT